MNNAAQSSLSGFIVRDTIGSKDETDANHDDASQSSGSLNDFEIFHDALENDMNMNTSPDKINDVRDDKNLFHDNLVVDTECETSINRSRSIDSHASRSENLSYTNSSAGSITPAVFASEKQNIRISKSGSSKSLNRVLSQKRLINGKTSDSSGTFYMFISESLFLSFKLIDSYFDN